MAALSYSIVSHAAQSTSERKPYDRTYLHTVMGRLSSCVFNDLGLNNPIGPFLDLRAKDTLHSTSALDSYGSKKEEADREKENEDKTLQLMFSASVPLDCMASTSTSLIIKALRQILQSTLADCQEGGAGVRTRLSTSCRSSLPNLLNMTQFAHKTAVTTAGTSTATGTGTSTATGTATGTGTSTGTFPTPTHTAKVTVTVTCGGRVTGTGTGTGFGTEGAGGTRGGGGIETGGVTGTGVVCNPHSVSSTHLLSMTEGICLAMVVRVVSDALPHAQDLFWYVRVFCVTVMITSVRYSMSHKVLNFN